MTNAVCRAYRSEGINDMPPMPPVWARIQRLAEHDPRRVVPIARRALQWASNEDNATQAWALFSLGWSLLCWERFDEARPYLRDAMAGFVAGNEHYGTLRCRHAFVLAEQIQHARLDIAEEFGMVADGLASFGDRPRACHARLYQAIVLTMRGQSDAAGRILTDLEAAIEPDDELNRGRFFRIQGANATGRGDYLRARQLLGQAEQCANKQQSRQELARAHFEQAHVYLRQERIEEAVQLYQRAEAAFRFLDLPLRIAFCAKAMGLAHSRLGNYDLALESILTALPYFTQIGRTRDIGGCQLNLGNIYLHTGSWEAALACYSRAETLYRTAGIVDEAIFVERNRAEIYRAQRHYYEALALLDDVERQAIATEDKAELAETYQLRAEIFGDTKQFTSALALSQQALQLFVQIDNRPGAAYCLLERGWLFLHQQQIHEAYDLFDQAAVHLQQHPHLFWRVVYGLARCAAAQHETITALERYREAALLVAGLRRRIANEAISSDLYIQAQELYHDGLRLAAQHGDIRSVLSLSESQRAMVLQRMLVERLPSPQESLGEEYQALRQRISALLPVKGAPSDPTALDAALADYGDLLVRARHSPSFTRLQATVPLPVFDLDELRSSLVQLYQSDWTALSYSYVDDQLLVTIITSATIDQHVVHANKMHHRLVEYATKANHRRRIFLDLPFLMRPEDGPWKTPRDLADDLLPSMVRTRLHPNHRLIVVPTGPLHAVPWSALRLNNLWLAEQAVIHVVPSLTTLQLLASRPAPTSSTTLFLGCGDFNTRDVPLPGVEAELHDLVALHGTRATLDYPAHCAALFDRSMNGELARFGRIHIASHGKLLGQRGLAAHLKLADDDLLLPDVAALRIGHALVVLSACDGAAADVLPGDEVFSLSHAFLSAGARGVIASQWPVYDLAVIPFMRDFYIALDQHGDAALALAQTQRQHIATYSDPTDERGTPFCWGSFVIVGGFAKENPGTFR